MDFFSSDLKLLTEISLTASGFGLVFFFVVAVTHFIMLS